MHKSSKEKCADSKRQRQIHSQERKQAKNDQETDMKRTPETGGMTRWLKAKVMTNYKTVG